MKTKPGTPAGVEISMVVVVGVGVEASPLLQKPTKRADNFNQLQFLTSCSRNEIKDFRWDNDLRGE